ncbi:hypothetical protein CB0940_06686 [Cercospora beticola]|uniref:Uncharacterized protein n=1 Tax=Cercospora beticola TaxID=122368 RepID=A0A2G5HYH4_CERBT|nr:hypothetical protein CB0940_06686 [Cercospora beticola]PIA97333.1 hypothetical protein CB0940_06686 [Cercospora beticola]WPA99359.1 hypothetical protein RHO25_003976 [Cercospora beticola]CAK1360686.1 unnamed protein product [Cercospora beticola]
MSTHDTGLSSDWDVLLRIGRQHAQHGAWEQASRALYTALERCQQLTNSDGDLNVCIILREIASVERAMGRYSNALAVLEQLLAKLGNTEQLRLKVLGEYGTVLRSMGRLEAARDAFSQQYDMALQLKAEQQKCRSIGNLGVINFQLWQRTGDDMLLSTAFTQLEDRVESARALRRVFATDSAKDSKVDYVLTLEAVGLARLSLCHDARGSKSEAVATALQSLGLARGLSDPTVEAISRFFYGRALLNVDKRTEALAQFDLPKACSPAVAFCKEPSEENHVYLKELLDCGADMDTPDEHSYTALDYAVFNGDQDAIGIVVESLRQRALIRKDNPEVQVAERVREAELRTGYREILQEGMRPLFLRPDNDTLQQVRIAYAGTHERYGKTGRSFDPLKFVRYQDFRDFQKFPRSSDGITQIFNETAKEIRHVVFISYRWVNRDPWAKFPDDSENSQYRRTLAAVDDFLAASPSIEPKSLGIWIDFACIDQDDPMPGIAALPMLIAQCDALISLVDERYYDRAWCSVEVMMIHALRKAYGLHAWYEHVDEPGNRYVLRAGPIQAEIDPSKKQLRFQSDLARVQFLQRQCQLLC